jgi:hypothetical protein
MGFAAAAGASAPKAPVLSTKTFFACIEGGEIIGVEAMPFTAQFCATDPGQVLTQITGPQGFQGAQGSQGVQGTQGTQGDQGFQGNQGFQGLQGTQGTQGFQGSQGTQGFQGFQGLQGTQGTQGFQGTRGFQGAQGFQGVQGTQGFQGIRGNQGFQGAASPTFESDLTGRTEGISVSASANELGAPSGISAAGFLTDETLSPTVPLSTSNFSAQLSTPAPAGGLQIGLRITGGSQVIVCNVAGGGTTCTASGPGTIPANTDFALSVINLDTTASWSGDVLFGYQVSG